MDQLVGVMIVLMYTIPLVGVYRLYKDTGNIFDSKLMLVYGWWMYLTFLTMCFLGVVSAGVLLVLGMDYFSIFGC
jgi:hypothetical protein